MNEKNIPISDDTELFLKKKKYHDAILKAKNDKNWDSNFCLFYQSGKFKVNNDELEISDFNVVEVEYQNKTLLILDYIYDNTFNKNYKIKKIYKLKNLLAFKEFYNYYHSNIKNNILILDDNSFQLLNNYIVQYGIEEHKDVPELLAKSEL